ncbi:HAD family hydrolase [Paenibacillus sp. HB172176]|uniref:HAD family hydrolase n=1 Tax=Paenibacillus sp. HB172176 TaxID=2493690 RepID=UPI0014393253|nr:HAD family hydrolase [Paenibacillus sp. HB172176]
MNNIAQTKPLAVIFDMDGTLFETDTLLIEVHRRVFQTLREEGLYMQDAPPVEKLLACLGMVLDDLWRKVMPDSTIEARRRADELLLQYELEGLQAGEGMLYAHVRETLEELHVRGVKLFVASNGLEDYVKGVAKFKDIDHLFQGLYSAGEFATASKVDLVARLLRDHGLDNVDDKSSIWMVGDRSSDVEAGKKNDIQAIGCAYAGYGKASELGGADRQISDFRELLW